MIRKQDRWCHYAMILTLLLFAWTIAFGCIPQAGKGEGIKTLAEMTSKEKATWMMGIYRSQDKDFRNQVARPDLTNEQKAILREKKKIMTQAWPLIKTYTSYVDSGAVPTREVEDQIIKLINDLTAMALPLITE